jgi:hypothetical protein
MGYPVPAVNPRNPNFLGKRTKAVQHRIGYCQNCGWIHGVVDIIKSEQNGRIIIKALCKKCQNDLERVIVCACCGEKFGLNLYPTTIERKRFNEDITNQTPLGEREVESTCNFIVLLCEDCKKLPHETILRNKTFTLPSDICNSCKDRFRCYTAKQEQPHGSVMDRNNFHTSWSLFRGKKKMRATRRRK